MLENTSSTKLRANLKDALKYVKESKEPLVVTVRGNPSVVILEIGEYEKLLSSTKNDNASEWKSHLEKVRGKNMFD